MARSGFLIQGAVLRLALASLMALAASAPQIVASRGGLLPAWRRSIRCWSSR